MDFRTTALKVHDWAWRSGNKKSHLFLNAAHVRHVWHVLIVLIDYTTTLIHEFPQTSNILFFSNPMLIQHIQEQIIITKCREYTSAYLEISMNNMFLMAVLHSRHDLQQRRNIKFWRITVIVRNAGVKKPNYQVITCLNFDLASFSFILPCATR